MVKLILSINYLAENKVLNIEIDNEKTFVEFRRIVSKLFNVDFDSISFLVSGYCLNNNDDSKKLKEINMIYDRSTLFLKINKIENKEELWTIYVVPVNNIEIIEIAIDKNKSFYEFKKIVSEKILCPIEDLILYGIFEYGYKYNSTKIKDMDGFYDQITLFSAVSIRG